MSRRTSDTVLYVCPGVDIDVVTDAVSAWGPAAPISVDVRRGFSCPPVVSDKDGVNRVGFGLIADRDPLAVTSRAFVQDDGELLEADIVLNESVPFGDAAAAEQVFDLQSVLTHEIGHFLGIDGHLLHHDASMFSCGVKNDTSQRTPEDSDFAALHAEYAGEQPEYADSFCSCSASDPSATLTLVLALFAIVTNKRILKKR